MRIEIIHAKAHMPEDYRDYLEGYRAVRLIDEAGTVRGELVWRLASRWNAVVEIKEFGLIRDSDKRQGWGTKLLDTAVRDMREYIDGLGLGYRFWKIYLLCEEKNSEARAFYKARGFSSDANLPDFYGPGEDAILYSRTP